MSCKFSHVTRTNGSSHLFFARTISGKSAIYPVPAPPLVLTCQSHVTSLSLSHTRSLSHTLALSHIISVPLSHSLSLSRSLSRSVALSLSLARSRARTPGTRQISLSHTLTDSLKHSLCLSVSLSLSIVSLSPSQAVSLSRCLALSRTRAHASHTSVRR